MSTGQKYSGKGEDATLPHQNAQTLEQTAQNTQISNSLNDQGCIQIKQRTYQVQTSLLQISDAFFALGFEGGPVQATSRLLTEWLSTPVEQLSNSGKVNQLPCTLLLIDFLEALYQRS